MPDDDPRYERHWYPLAGGFLILYGFFRGGRPVIAAPLLVLACLCFLAGGAGWRFPPRIPRVGPIPIPKFSPAMLNVIRRVVVAGAVVGLAVGVFGIARDLKERIWPDPTEKELFLP